MRAIGKYSVSFGLFNVPINLYSAVSEKKPKFNQINKDTKNRIKYLKVDSVTNEQVDNSNIIKGYELMKGNYVTFDEQELIQLRADKDMFIKVKGLVKREKISHRYPKNFYYLEGQKGYEQHFYMLRRLLALDNEFNTGISEITLRTQRYECALIPYNNTILLMVLHSKEDINDSDLLNTKVFDLDNETLNLLTEMNMKYQMESIPEYTDTYRNEIHKAIELKAQGKEWKAVTIKPSTPFMDIKESLKATLDERDRELKPKKQKIKAK